MSRTSDLHIDEQVRDEMAREAGPELAKALEIIAAIASGSRTVNSLPNIARLANDALRKAGLEP